MWNSVGFCSRFSLSLSLSELHSVAVLSLSLALRHFHGLPETEIGGVELGSGEEEQRRTEDEAGWERIVPWKLGLTDSESPEVGGLRHIFEIPVELVLYWIVVFQVFDY